MSYTGVDGELRETIDHYVACGFEGPQTVYMRVCEMFDAADPAEVDGFVDESFAARDQAAAAWPAVTDCDRLDRAFEALDTSGIVARQNFACCHNCGRYEIVDEIADARNDRRRVDGFVFYHMQDTDSAVRGGVLHLHYDGTVGTETIAIGTRIVAALRDAGLATQWNGDATKAIEVALRWQRRAAPRAAERTPTAAECVAMWCAALPAATLSAAAANAGDDFAVALDAAGRHSEALAWARAPRDDGARACALARLAVARGSPELLVEAWQLAPWDDHTFVTLLCESGLDNPQVHTIACDKIREMRGDAYGGAAAAWLYVRAPDLEPARDRARHEWNRQRNASPDAALLALAAGLWRAGDAALREPVMSKFRSADHEWAQLAVIAGATAVEDLITLSNEAASTDAPERLCCRALARLVELGAVDAARTYAKQSGDAYVAHVAWRSGDVAALEAIAANVNEYALQYEEGLINVTELRDLRVAVAAGIGLAQPARARALLAELAATACSDALAEELAAALARLAGRTVDPDPGRPLSKYNPTLNTAIAQWAEDVPIRRRFGLRRAGRTMLAHAAAYARRGELARAHELIELVLAPLSADELDDAIRNAGIDDRIIEAWIAVGDLERVDQFVRGELGPRTLSCAASGAYVPALIAADERERGLALLAAALAAARTRRELLELIPAVLAVAGDATGEIHAAWRAADAVLGTLTISA